MTATVNRARRQTAAARLPGGPKLLARRSVISSSPRAVRSVCFVHYVYEIVH